MEIILLLVIIALLILPALFGSLVLFRVLIRPKKSPADKSNRINHLRLVWFALTREDLFVDAFPWMKHDEYDNITRK